MKMRSAIMLSGALALMLVSGCQSSPEPESAPTPAAGQSGTVEASEPEYSADLELTVTFPDIIISVCVLDVHLGSSLILW